MTPLPLDCHFPISIFFHGFYNASTASEKNAISAVLPYSQHAAVLSRLRSGLIILCGTSIYYYYWHIYPPITRKRSMRYTSSLRSCRPFVYHTKMGEFR